MTKYEKIINEVHQAVLGVKDTDDKGMVGDLKELKGHVKKQNGRITRLEITVASLVTALTGAGILDATIFHVVFGG